MLFTSDRLFRLWDYHVSHSHLLLRSPGRATTEKTIDVVFSGVSYMEVPTMFPGISLWVSDPADRSRAESILGFQDDLHRVFGVLCDGRRHLVVAVGLAVFRNDRDHFDSSLEHLSEAMDDLCLGELIVRF